jgi:hypothetical protein
MGFTQEREEFMNRIDSVKVRALAASILSRAGYLSLVVMPLVLASAALAGYKSLKVKVDPAQSYPFHQTQSNVTIAADPYETNEKIRTAFDVKDLEKLGIVPVNIVISNEGEDLISINGEDINLLDDKNRSIQSTAPEEVVQLILNKGKAPSSRSRTPSPIPLPRREGLRGDAFEIETDFRNKALKEVRVAPKTTASGFLFFRLPGKETRLSRYKIYIPEIKSLKTKQNLLFFEIEFK